MKKGFTLIEVLAVVGLIGILALVITPIGIEIYNNARDKILLTTAKRLIDSTDTYIKNYELEYGKKISSLKIEIKDKKIEDNLLNISGNLPQIGEIYIKDEEIAIVIYDGGTCAYKDYNEIDINISKKEITECTYSQIFNKSEKST